MKSSGQSGRAVFWDFDGTLSVPCHLWSGSLHQTLGEAGHDVPLEPVRAFTASGVYSWDRPEQGYRAGEWWPGLFRELEHFYRAQGIPEALHPRINQGLRRRILDPAGYRLYPDALETLAAVRERDYQNYILSNNYPELEQVLARLGLSHYFSGCVVSGAVGWEKPHPALFRHALALAGHPHTTYMVGDNPVADIAGGRAAGMRTILVHRNDETCGADFVLDHLAQIPAILQ